jgi:thiol-disulfide isomerase/thioredoxin
MKFALPRSLALLLVLSAPLATLDGEPVVPMAAPAWTLKDPDGKPVSSDQFKGKVVVLDFWATWCVPCRAEIPGYIELQKKYAADGVVFVGVSIDSDGAMIVKKFIAENGINYPVVLAGDSDVLEKYDQSGIIPTAFIIDRMGQIRDVTVGKVPTADFEKGILSVLRPSAK